MRATRATYPGYRWREPGLDPAALWQPAPLAESPVPELRAIAERDGADFGLDSLLAQTGYSLGRLGGMLGDLGRSALPQVLDEASPYLAARRREFEADRLGLQPTMRELVALGEQLGPGPQQPMYDPRFPDRAGLERVVRPHEAALGAVGGAFDQLGSWVERNVWGDIEDTSGNYNKNILPALEQPLADLVLGRMTGIPWWMRTAGRSDGPWWEGWSQGDWQQWRDA